jgi:hypothetical protein
VRLEGLGQLKKPMTSFQSNPNQYGDDARYTDIYLKCTMDCFPSLCIKMLVFVKAIKITADCNSKGTTACVTHSLVDFLEVWRNHSPWRACFFQAQYLTPVTGREGP